jgi:hypothetical protein
MNRVKKFFLLAKFSIWQYSKLRESTFFTLPPNCWTYDVQIIVYIYYLAVNWQEGWLSLMTLHKTATTTYWNITDILTERQSVTGSGLVRDFSATQENLVLRMKTSLKKRRRRSSLRRRENDWQSDTEIALAGSDPHVQPESLVL